MKITFGIITIASEFPDGGTDAIEGFEADGEGKVQVAEYPRADYAKLFPRGNRVITHTGTVRPAPAPTLAAALLAAEQVYGSLPDQADLVKLQDGVSVTYPKAVLKSFKRLKDLRGVSFGYQLTFVSGPPSVSAPGAVLGDGHGAVLGDGSGDELGTGT